jgi:multicomponent Na+:H+ antiporter subunit E
MGVTGIGSRVTGAVGFNLRGLIVAVVLTVIWWVLSGRFDLLHFGTGVVTAVILAANYRAIPDGTRLKPLQFLLFVPWLIYQILLSNLRVARSVLSVSMPINPVFISQPPGVRGDRPLSLLGAGTTLTPGTLTVDIGEQEFFVHALDRQSAADTRANLVAQQVARVFDRATP